MKKEIKELMELDKLFCLESQKTGVESWAKYLSKKAIMGTPKHEAYIKDRSKMVSLVGMIYRLDNIDFTWEPLHAFISKDSTLGVTTGTYIRTYKIEDKEFKEIGKYVTTWQKEEGKWKIVFDMGN
ncbi:hypothetical protein KQ51_01002 [Candidatus Izimaplasma bacterium HR1]|jgi:hypothetical protein|uniref:nuclear transport factor 2 family protein n=1 Tax=Candidatus Izimoplasma sp. HR1 TaxID=1541959 RepID=UPI0004F7C189|nr:hypothetical protein KQ51_01002 [Candidatus Izimaplasma bacterium HR1]